MNRPDPIAPDRNGWPAVGPSGASTPIPETDWSAGAAALPPPDNAALSAADALKRLLGAFGPDAAPPPTLGPAPAGYQMLRRLGRGAMGDVYLACQVRLKRLVALKMIRANLSGAGVRERFQAEAEAVARLQHPNIVQIYEVGDIDGQPFLALEYVAGGSLDGHLNGMPLPPGDAADLVQGLARAVQHAHERGLVHRDLKPGNVLLQRTEDRVQRAEDTEEAVLSSVVCLLSSVLPKVSDFGLAQRLGAADSPRAGAVVGTPSYMAPEQAAGDHHRIGPRTDVYALGAILYECLTGRPPFRGASVDETLAQVRDREPVPVRQLRPGVPRDLETIALKCLQKEPDRRYASATELADDLARFVRGEPVYARPLGPVGRLWKWARRRPVVAALGGLSALALVSLIVGGAVYQALLREANQQSRRHQARAEANYQKALAAVESLLTRVGNDRLVNVPEMDGVRAELLQDALTFYKGFLTDTDDQDPAVRRETALAHARVARIEHLLGRMDEADANYRLAIDQLGALAAEFPDRAVYRDGQADALQEYGKLLVRGKDRDRVGEQFDHARRLWLALAADQPDVTRYRAQAATCDHLEGWWHLQTGRLPEAETALRRALERRRELADREPSDDARRDLAMTLHNLANICSTTNRSDDALRHESEATELFEALVRARPWDEEVRGYLTGALNNFGVINDWAGRPDDAWQAHDRARQLREALARAHPLVSELQSAWAQSCMNVAAVDIARGRQAAAEPHARQAVAILERIVPPQSQDVRGLETLLAAHTNLAQLLQGSRRSDEALTVYGQALPAAERLASEFADNPLHATALAELCLNRGNLDKDAGRLRDAITWYERSMRAADEALAKDGRLMEARHVRLNAYGARAQAHEHLKDFMAAVRDWDHVVDWSVGADRKTYRLLRAAALAQARAYDRVTVEVTALAAEVKDAPALEHLAGTCATAAAAASRDEGLPDVERRRQAGALASQGWMLLRRALAVADFQQRAQIVLGVLKDPDLRDLGLWVTGTPPERH
jgi:serine/threonine protein kinase/tetratricopeptide (TPR) repeat protein